MIQELLDQVTAFYARLKTSSSVNVNDHRTKAGSIELATTYFKTYRPRLVELIGVTDELRDHDQKWQDFVRLAHGNNQRKTYLKLLNTISKELKELSVVSIARSAEKGGSGVGPSDLTPAELQLLATLESLLPTAAASYRQGILDLRERDRLSYRGTASEFREALRETLDHLAPDGEVTKQPGFKLEDAQNRPTMKQKARFILMSRGRGKTQTFAAEKSVGVIEGLTGELVRATYDRASLATHIETTRSEVLRIKRYVDTLLFDLLEVSGEDRKI